MNELIEKQEEFLNVGFKTVLYTQGETPLDKDKIIVDGKLYPFDSSNQMLYDSQSLLLSKTGMKKLDLKSDDLKCFYKKDGGIFFQGLYKTTVKSGSRNYYMYYADTDDIDKAISQFKLLSERVLHYEWSDTDLELISQKYKKKVSSTNLLIKLLVVLAVLAIGSLLILVLKPRPETNIKTDVKDSLKVNSNCEINNNYDGQ